MLLNLYGIQSQLIEELVQISVSTLQSSMMSPVFQLAFPFKTSSFQGVYHLNVLIKRLIFFSFTWKYILNLEYSSFFSYQRVGNQILIFLIIKSMLLCLFNLLVFCYQVLILLFEASRILYSCFCFFSLLLTFLMLLFVSFKF